MKSAKGLRPPKISTKELRSPEKSKWVYMLTLFKYNGQVTTEDVN